MWKKRATFHWALPDGVHARVATGVHDPRLASASGAVIEQVSTESEAAVIVPETVGDVFEQTLCSLLKAKREEPPPKPPAEKEKIETPTPPAYNDVESRPSGTL